MDYTELHFTEEDKQRLLQNKEEMVKWIMDNIVPFIQEDSKIKIDFGGIYHCPRSYSSVENYHFYVYGSKQKFYSGGGSNTEGYIGFGEKFGGISEAFETVRSPYDIYPIMDNWDMIKRTLLGSIKEQKENRKAIYSFQV